MSGGEWLLVQFVATLVALIGGLFVSHRLSENGDLLKGHGAVVAAGGAWGGNATQVIVGRDMERHDYGGLIVWGVVVLVILAIWVGPLLVAALRSRPSDRS